MNKNKQKLYVAVTGHRPKDIGGYDENNPTRLCVKEKIKQVLLNYKKKYNIVGITGLAQGVDSDFAKICIDLKIPYYGYAPFLGQEVKWPENSQKQYRDLINHAAKFTVVSEGSYSVDKMHKRNEAMVDNANLIIAVYNGKGSGGTYNCIQYAKRKNKKIIYINPNDCLTK